MLMQSYAIVVSGGKQYLVKEGESIVVDAVSGKAGDSVKLDVLAIFTEDGKKLDIGKPTLKKKMIAVIEETGKGTKIRVAKFKAKVRYRKVQGFRPTLSRLKITSLEA